MKKNLSVLLIFIALTIVMNYPRSINLTDTLDEKGDSLLNTWIIAWNVHKLTSNIDGYFDGNIFYPHSNVLAYSEHLFASAIVALPAIIITKNPILGYNTVWFLSYVLSGWGMYLLVNYLVKNSLAAIIAGIIFSFFPFRYAHLGHLQLLTAHWIPFTFLYLHKFFDNNSYKNILLLTLFYILTVLSCGYYALFTTMFVGLYVLGILSINYKKLSFDYTFWLKISLFIFIVLAVTGPFFYHYYLMKKSMGFSRSIEESIYYSADIKSYLSTSPLNRIYGKLSERFWKPEGELFTGITPIILSIIGIWKYFYNSPPTTQYFSFEEESKSSLLYKYVIKFINFGIILYVIVVSIIIFYGGFHIDIKNIHNSIVLSIIATGLDKPILILISLLLVRLAFNKNIRDVVKRCFINRLLQIPVTQRYYLVVLLLAFLFSLGPIIHFFDLSTSFGPYILLYYFVPGFDGLRVPARFVIMVMLALCVLSGYGFKRIADKFSNGKIKTAVCSLVSFFILLEFFSAPLPLAHIKTGNDIPDVYKWLANIKEDVAIQELPMIDVWHETPYMYYSTYHWKNLVNGFSGYSPPAYIMMKDLMKNFPSPLSVKALRDINVDYVILHSADYEKHEWEKIHKEMGKFKNSIQLVKKFDTDYVFKIIVRNNQTYNHQDNMAPNMSKNTWIASSNLNNNSVNLAFDGDLDTRWSTNKPQNPGTFFTIDFGSHYNIHKITISLKKHTSDYPRGYKVEASNDGIAWKQIGGKVEFYPPITSYVKNPKTPEFELNITPTECRFIKITQTNKHNINYWSINEIDVFGEIV